MLFWTPDKTTLVRNSPFDWPMPDEGVPFLKRGIIFVILLCFAIILVTEVLKLQL